MKTFTYRSYKAVPAVVVFECQAHCIGDADALLFASTGIRAAKESRMDVQIRGLNHEA